MQSAMTQGIVGTAQDKKNQDANLTPEQKAYNSLQTQQEAPAASSGAMGSPTHTNKVQPVTYAENGDASVRQALLNRGIANERIGFNTGTGNITIDGQDIVAPGSVKDGVSYANEQVINQLTDEAYKKSGNELVSATQYSASSGFGNMVKWDGATGMVSVGGLNIKPVYVSSDGIAYVKKSEIDAAIAQIRQSAGIKTDAQVKDDWYDKYGKQAEAAERSVRDFSYDPTKDKEYQAYAAYQMREKQKQAQDAAARAADASGAYGGVNSQAIASSLFNSQQQIASAIPQYAQQAYERTQQNLDNIRTLGNDYYNKDLTAAENAWDKYQAALDADYDRRRQEVEDAQKARENRSVNFRNDIIDARYADRADMQDQYQRLTLDEARNNMINTLEQMGGRSTEDTAGLKGYTMPDGSFISINDISAGVLPSPWQWVRDQAYYNAVGQNDANLEYQQRLAAWQMGL